MSPTPVALVTGTYDNADIIEDVLRYHLALGVDVVFVTDCGSTDGTWELLNSSRWSGLVHAIRRPSVRLSEYDISTEALRRVRKMHDPTWVLLSDPDEFWLSPTMDLKGDLEAEAEKGNNLLIVERYNMTGLRDEGVIGGSADDFLVHNQLCICRPTQRTHEEMLGAALGSPWIFTKVGPKLCVGPGFVQRVCAGDHDVVVEPRRVAIDHGFGIRHVPIRSYREFHRKIVNARADLAAQDLPELEAWHWRRWVRLYESGALYDEYLAQFLPEEEAVALSRSGVVAVDDRVAQRLALTRRSAG